MTVSLGPSSILSVEKILKLIQSEGLFCRVFQGFEVRASQQEMMKDIINAYNHNQIALIEAGTGTGKSMAYLLPAILWAAQTHERTVISTNTITLQEQLVQKDIPNLLKALNLNLKAVLVKGMNNYLCLRKMFDAQSEFLLFSQDDREEMNQIEQWSRHTVEGSKSELSFVPTPNTWEKVGAESETCSHNQCPYYHQCFFYKARKQAEEAHLLVVNHHLLFADLVKRGENNNYVDTAILPSYKRLILDEAHHIEDVATEYFAHRLHRIELVRTLSRLTSEKHHTGQGKLIILKDRIQSTFKKAPPSEITPILTKLTIDFPAVKHVLTEQIHHTFDAFINFIEVLQKDQDSNYLGLEQKQRLLEEHRTHPKWADEVIPRAEGLMETLKRYSQDLRSLENDFKLLDHEKLNEQTKGVRAEIQGLTMRLDTSISTLYHFLNRWGDNTRVRWIELHQLKTLLNVHLVDAELDMSKALVEFMFSQFPTIILCSATLTSNRSFTFVRKRLGITREYLPQRYVVESIYDSTFDYKKQALLAVPKDMPLPNHPDFNARVYEGIWQAIQASQGQAFILFTSYSLLKQCYEVLAQRLKEGGYPLFKQGDNSRQKLLHQFTNTKRAVLFGTDSFWEGVDVVGDALRCVVIVKLPFKVPSDPLVQARTEAILEKGGDPFFEFAIPNAIVKFKQGFGRLIRNQFDRGCIICLDVRLISKGYGKLFINSLPPCQEAFYPNQELWPKIKEFYKKTYYLTKQSR